MNIPQHDTIIGMGILPMIYPVGCIVKSCIPVVQGSSEPKDEDTLQHLIELAMIL